MPSSTTLTLETANGNPRILKRIETVPDIKRDTSGETTQYVAAGVVNLGAVAAGICVAWSSSVLPLVTIGQSNPEYGGPNGTSIKQFITETEGSWATSLLCLGALCGAVPAGLISEHFGRKKTLLYLALPLLVSWLLVASSPNVYGLYVGRFIGGIAVGAFSVSIPPYIEDIAEKQVLPALVNFYHVQFAVGVLLGYIMGLAHSSTWYCMLSSIVPTAFFIAFIFLPESPAYLITQGKNIEARAAIRYFRGIDNDVDAEMKALKDHLLNHSRTRVTFKELFGNRTTVKPLIVSFGLMIFQQMSGIYPVLFFAENIFSSSDVTLVPSSASVILGFCFLSSTYFSTFLLKKVKRRALLMISFATMALSLGCLTINYHMKASDITYHSTWIPIIALCVFVSVYASGVGPIPWLMLREIFPANVTRRATAINAGFHWLLAFGVIKLYKNLVDMLKTGWALWTFALTCVVAVVFVYFFVPETKGRTLKDIQNEFEGIPKKKVHTHVIEVEYVAQ